MTPELVGKFVVLSEISVLIPLVVGILFYSHHAFPTRIFVYYFVVCVITEIAAYQMAVRYGTNIVLLHLFVPLEYLFLSSVYYFHFKDKKIKMIILLSAIILLLTSIMEAFNAGVKEHNVLSRSVSSIFLVCISMTYFFLQFQESTGISIWKQQLFWISCGVLVYFSLEFFSFMMINLLLKKNAELALLSKLIHSIINILSYMLYTSAFICREKKTT